MSRAGACRPSQSSASPTAGNRARTTASQSFRPPVSKKPRIVVGGEFRVNSGAWNTEAVGTPTPGKITTYQESDPSETGVSCSPIPSPQADLPATKMGTSAPNVAPIAANCAEVEPDAPNLVQRHQHGGGIRATPAQPAAHGNSLLHGDFGPQRSAVTPVSAPGPPGPPGPRTPPRRPAPRGRVIAPSVRTVISIRSQRSMQLEHGLKLVVAVGPTPDDVQHQVQFGRGRPDRMTHGCQRSTSSFMRAPSRVAVSRCGKRKSQRRRTRIDADAPAVLREDGDLAVGFIHGRFCSPAPECPTATSAIPPAAKRSRDVSRVRRAPRHRRVDRRDSSRC